MMTSEKKKTIKKKIVKVREGGFKERRRVRAQKVLHEIVQDPSLSITQAGLRAGLPPTIAAQPARIVNTPEWNELLDQYLPRSELLDVHQGLLRASRLDHMVFPVNEPSDDAIREMLQAVNCTVRKIVHGEMQRHVYFFAADNRARKDALEMAYKLRGDFAADKAAAAFSLVALARLSDGGSTPDTLPAHADSVQLPTRLLE